MQTPAPAAPLALSAVDVMAKLEALPAASVQPLKWKTSIVDRLKRLAANGGAIPKQWLRAAPAPRRCASAPDRRGAGRRG